MPRYLRWTAAVTAGIVVQFAFQIALLAILVGTGGEEVSLSGASGALITFGAGILNVIAALWVNDWLSARYPLEERQRARGGS